MKPDTRLKPIKEFRVYKRNLPHFELAGSIYFIKAIIEAVHKFANGGRHLPEERAKSGGFEIDHIDAEYVRGIVTIDVAYLAKHLQSRKSLS